jgi:quercetin dioxygenase-like cupin family protein
MIPKGISHSRGQTARTCLTLGWWETRTRSLWPAKTPPVAICLIDMHIPTGGGPPPHRHDFEEMFSVLEGEIEATFRGRKTIIRAGETINIPANAPHQFQNTSGQPARLLCLCSPAGQEEFFKEVGVLSRRGQHSRPHSTRRPRQRSSRRLKPLLRNAEPSFYPLRLELWANPQAPACMAAINVNQKERTPCVGKRNRKWPRPPQQLRQLGDVGRNAPCLVALRISGTPSTGIGFARLGPKTGVRYATKTRRLV